MTILDKILAHKREEVASAKRERPADALAAEAAAESTPPRGFRNAILETEGVSVIAEVKRQSPSKGLIRADFDPVEIAHAYRAAGAACISVLTDHEFFGGSLEIFAQVRNAVDTPLIRKDFIVDAYQIDEARLYGADAILLIVSALSDPELAGFHEHAIGLGLDVLVEVHDEAELDRALNINATLVGVNNRNLRTFEVDLATTERLAARLPNSNVTLIAESGIADADDVARLERAGAAGFLVGESLMRQPDPGKALEALRRRP
ncbi:MAG: indole-3-glycerol phosphate synthase TrpC [Myxococcota bacterium]